MNLSVRISEIRLAFSFLTILPIAVSGVDEEEIDLSSCVWAFPLVGVSLGLLAGLVYYFCWIIGLSSLLAALASISALVLFTGGLHEDGLADLADGFGGGRDSEHALTIMRDSTLGTYGTLALILIIGGRVGAVSQIGTTEPGFVISALISAACLSRTCCLLVIAGLPPARSAGLGHSIRNPDTTNLMGAGALCLICIILLLDYKSLLLSVGVAVMITILLLKQARKKIGGFTGDVIGATILFSELAVLLCICVSLNN